MAKKGIANSKKALAFTKAFLDQNGNLLSGTTEEDLYEYVNTEMYIALKLDSSAASEVAVDADDSDGEDTQLNVASLTQPSVIEGTFDEDEESFTQPEDSFMRGENALNESVDLMPNQDLDENVVEKATEGYFFPGYFAFVLCGPFGDKDHESVLLGLD